MAKKKIPLMVMKINPESGSMVNGISIVGSPAIESNFISFNADEEPKGITFAADNERMELLGAAMIPDLPMYRNTKGVGEYYSVFQSADIRQIAQVFAEKGFFNNMNIDHDSAVPAGSYVFQSYIVDSTLGVNSPKGLDLPDGSWIVGVKVNDRSVWQDIQSGKVNGFSVEGFFDLFETDIELDAEFSKEEIALAEEFELALIAYLSSEED